MIRSLATVSLSGNLSEKLEAAATARFDAVEIFENDLIYFAAKPGDVRQIAEDLGLAIAVFQPFRDFEAAPRERFQRNLDRAERKFDVMAALGANLMLVCSNVAPDTAADDDLAAADLRQLAERAAARGLKIGYEALCWGQRVSDYSHAWRIVEKAGHPSLGLIVDSFHTLAIGDDPAGLADIPGDRIFLVQIADAPKLDLDLLSWSRHFRCFPGQGQLDVAGFLEPILRAGYGGALSLEIFNDDFRAAPARATAADGMRSLLYLEERTADRLRAMTPPATVQADLFQPPKPPAYDDIQFIEFAADAATEPALGAFFETMGFRRVGRHRSKDVSLYRQGPINFIVNTEPESFAHSFYLLHGTSVCALALGVGDDQQAVNRARLYHAAPYEGQVGPNELVIPAMRAPDGSLLYLVETGEKAPSPFDVDFVVDDAADQTSVQPGGAPQRIDHVSLALPEGQMDTWLLFFRAVFGFAAEDIWILPDPYGMVRSRAVRSANGRIRFPLNISESRRTATARFVSAYSGAGVHHIALATPDIFAAAEAMQKRGLARLDIPENYYEDLVAKLGLADEFAARMQALGILYDRSEDGEFLHFFTQPFQDRFFFEFLERRGYDAYGAANAPVRMAAQANARATPELDALVQTL